MMEELLVGSHEAAELKRKLVAVRPPRQVAPPPEQVAVEHSATYLLRSRRPLDEASLPLPGICYWLGKARQHG